MTKCFKIQEKVRSLSVCHVSQIYKVDPVDQYGNCKVDHEISFSGSKKE